MLLLRLVSANAQMWRFQCEQWTGYGRGFYKTSLLLFGTFMFLAAVAQLILGSYVYDKVGADTSCVNCGAKQRTTCMSSFLVPAPAGYHKTLSLPLSCAIPSIRSDAGSPLTCFECGGNRTQVRCFDAQRQQLSSWARGRARYALQHLGLLLHLP